MLTYDSLPSQLLALLQAGRAVTVRWDCGSDSSFVTTKLDGVEQAIDLGADYRDWMFAERDEYNAYMARLTNLPLLLDGFLTERLRLPSVGDFHMQGGGRIFLEAGAIWLEYQSDATRWNDAPEPADWLPEYYLSPAELTELFPERVAARAGPPDEDPRHPDLEMAAAYTGREVLLQLS